MQMFVRGMNGLAWHRGTGGNGVGNWGPIESVLGFALCLADKGLGYLLR